MSPIFYVNATYNVCVLHRWAPKRMKNVSRQCHVALHTAHSHTVTTNRTHTIMCPLLRCLWFSWISAVTDLTTNNRMAGIFRLASVRWKLDNISCYTFHCCWNYSAHNRHEMDIHKHSMTGTYTRIWILDIYVDSELVRILSCCQSQIVLNRV